MNRDAMLAAARDGRTRDVLVVGGGATGLATAVDAAARGYSTLLLEAADFAHGTSSRSTKLVHGGVRYLQQGDVGLVMEALRERGRLLENAPHLVHNQSFVVPVYDWWEGPFYGIGLKLYDVLAGKLGLGPSEWLSRDETIERIPTIEPGGLRGGVIYYDGQFDDARLAITLARTAADHGATLVNYCPVTGLLEAAGSGPARVSGVAARDEESGEAFEIRARVVVNATGAFTDAIRRMDDPASPPIIRPSQGVHIVLDRSFLPGDSAIMVPHTDDGRVLFAVPWHGRIIVGTTDTPIDEPVLEPRPQEAEIEFLLTHAVRYLTKDPSRDDVLSMFAGIRPLVVAADGREAKADGRTASISRDHSLFVSDSGLVTIAGGKWTTCRKMAEDTVDLAAEVGGLESRSCPTEELRLHGAGDDPVTGPGDDEPPAEQPLRVYGTDAAAVRELAAGEAPAGEADPGAPLHPALPYLRAEITWAVRHEMARTVDDVLARRTRALLLDARAASEAAETVAAVMAAELDRDQAWMDGQVAAFRHTAAGYLP